MNRYTQRSHWEDGHWCVPLVQFANEKGKIPDGQYVPQVVIDRLAELESIMELLEENNVTPKDVLFAATIKKHIPADRFKEIMDAEMDGRLTITPKGEWEET